MKVTQEDGGVDVTLSLEELLTYPTRGDGTVREVLAETVSVMCGVDRRSFPYATPAFRDVYGTPAMVFCYRVDQREVR